MKIADLVMQIEALTTLVTKLDERIIQLERKVRPDMRKPHPQVSSEVRAQRIKESEQRRENLRNKMLRGLN